ncbi:hypothetical protein O181_036085 [Austropuccinia psidii MF-1]|uniref:fumarate reductase (NADH) n=1 Tax=Austropuccinia psidii MF-1 TaxID=1389203 RepID=A0A9Q3D883_9BASI|nr:hypothetical protein [Austropuccinia psidii MF-1]
MSKVIVVGGGLSGLSAAHTLYDRGANVLVLDKNPFFGGNSTKATSGINGAGTNSQAALGIPDSAKVFFDDTKKSARDLARDDLIKVLTGKSAEAVNWLQDKFNLDLSKVSRLGGHSFERTHRGGAQFPGMTITYAQMEALEELAEKDPNRVQIIKKAKVNKLLKDNAGAVIGVEYEFDGKTFTENGPVILATGGYAADFSSDGLLAKYRPDLLKLPTTNGDHCTGDGQKMVIAVGGAGIDWEKVQVHPTGLVDPNEPDAKVKFLAAEALRGVGGILLDREGNRFVDELGHRDYVTGKMWENNKFPIRLVLNKDSSEEILWHCKHYVGRGLMKRFDNGHELAKEFGIPESKLKNTFDEYVEISQGKKPDPHKKKFFHNYNFTLDGPFYVASMTPVLHYSMGGVEINDKSQVLDSSKKPIPGLYASGEIAGGVHGANRLGGSSLLGCVVFGRVAADSASSYLLRSLATGSGPAARLGQIQNHLKTTVEVRPDSKNVQLTFSWDDVGSTAPEVGSQQSAAAQSAPPKQTPNQAGPNGPGAGKTIVNEQTLKEYTLDDVAKHKTKDDVWVVVNGEVLDVTKFKADHPGGEKAIMLYAGRDATEEFNMLHDPKVVKKYAPESIIGKLKQ